MNQALYFPKFVKCNIIYNQKREVEALIIILASHLIQDKIFQRKVVSFRLSIFDQLKDNTEKFFVSLITTNNNEITVGTEISLDIGNEQQPIHVPLFVENKSINFYKQWKANGAVLEFYTKDYCPFSIN